MGISHHIIHVPWFSHDFPMIFHDFTMISHDFPMIFPLIQWIFQPQTVSCVQLRDPSARFSTQAFWAPPFFPGNVMKKRMD